MKRWARLLGILVVSMALGCAAYASPECNPDSNGDGTVDREDVKIVRAELVTELRQNWEPWLQDCYRSRQPCGDVNGDGEVDGQDRRAMFRTTGSAAREQMDSWLNGCWSAYYPVVDTGQIQCFDEYHRISCPQAGLSYFGQDAQFSGFPPAYRNNQDGTVTDLNTGLMWQQGPDTNGDGDVDAADKLTYPEAQAYCDQLELAGYRDWRLPNIKQLYSLIDFGGVDPSGTSETDTSGLIPFIDTDVFRFGYGDTAAGERIIDAQYASGTLYVAATANDGGGTLFGVNFADGRIKGYGLTLFGRDKTFYVQCTRGNVHYGENRLVDHGDGTISDQATGLMWTQNDSGTGMNWEEALAWVEQKNSEHFLGYDDWRLPDAKELQSLVDYSRSPDTTGSAAIDPLFHVSVIQNEAGQTDYPAYWSSTTHINGTENPGANAVYVAFGRAMGYMNGSWVDVHGAGAQRSDPKTGDPAVYPTGRGPQGDAIRIDNYVRLVRDDIP